VAGVALGALGWLWWPLGRALIARGAAPLCVAGVALGDIHLRFAWQAKHFMHLRFRGRRCTWGTGLRAWARSVARGTAPLCVAGVALGDIHFAWQAWHVVTSTFVLRGRRGTCGTWLAVWHFVKHHL